MKRLLLLITISLFFVLSACSSQNGEYIIYFDSNTEDEVTMSEIDPTDPLSVPTDPVKDGYVFAGWYWDDETFTQPFTINSILDAPLSSKLTVYAKWEFEPTTLSTTLLGIYNLGLEAVAIDMTYEEWLESIRGEQGIPGENGKDVFLQVDNGLLQWQHLGDDDWTDLLSLDTLVGSDGTEISLQVADGFIQWQYVDESTWTNLIDISTLIGATGEDGINGIDGREITMQVTDGFIQWQYVGQDTWTNLLDVSLLAGSDGIDGREVELRSSEGYIQWKYTDDDTWTDLFNLNTITPQVTVNVAAPTVNVGGSSVSINTTGLIQDDLAFGEIIGHTSGLIEGDSLYAGVEMMHIIYGVKTDLSVPMDPLTGVPSGYINMNPVEIIMHDSKTSPHLFQMFFTQELIDSFEIQIFRQEFSLKTTHYYTILLEDAYIGSISREKLPAYDDTLYQYGGNILILEVYYQTITWTNEADGITYTATNPNSGF